MEITDVGLGAVPRHEFDGGATDHLALVVDGRWSDEGAVRTASSAR
jgi:hypothetical protein